MCSPVALLCVLGRILYLSGPHLPPPIFKSKRSCTWWSPRTVPALKSCDSLPGPLMHYLGSEALPQRAFGSVEEQECRGHQGA